MSNSRRIRRRCRSAGHDTWFSVMVGWARSYDDLDLCQTQLHDKLIAMLGPKRRGPVTWIWRGGDQALALLDTLDRDDDEPELREHYARVRSHLEEHGGLVVVAKAEAIR